MSDKDPFSINEMFKAFSPERIERMFDPLALMSSFQPSGGMSVDLGELAQTQRRNFDAMVAANTAAGAAYQALLEHQMQIFDELTAAANAQIAALPDPGPDAVMQRTEAYGAAVERALQLMRELAEAAQQANEEVFQTFRGRAAEIVAQMKQA